MDEPHVVTLRATRAADLDELFRIHSPGDGAHEALVAFRDHSGLRAEGTDVRTVRADGAIVGTVLRRGDDVRCVIAPDARRHGIGSRALRLFLDTQPRPIRARCRVDDAASLRTLRALGFVETDDAHGELVLELA